MAEEDTPDVTLRWPGTESTEERQPAPSSRGRALSSEPTDPTSERASTERNFLRLRLAADRNADPGEAAAIPVEASHLTAEVAHLRSEVSELGKRVEQLEAHSRASTDRHDYPDNV